MCASSVVTSWRAAFRNPTCCRRAIGGPVASAATTTLTTDPMTPRWNIPMKAKTLLSALALTLSVATLGYAAPVKHAQGETDIDGVPQKVIVFDLAAVDTLDALGVEIDGLPTGILPPYLQKYAGSNTTNVGTMFEPDFEAVAAMEPDLIIVGGRSAPKYAELSKLAPTINLTVDRTNFFAS